MKRELELTQMLKEEKLNVMFLTVTDIKELASKNDYNIYSYSIPRNGGRNRFA